LGFYDSLPYLIKGEDKSDSGRDIIRRPEATDDRGVKEIPSRFF
jgi:hypothetical protein